MGTLPGSWPEQTIAKCHETECGQQLEGKPRIAIATQGAEQLQEAEHQSDQKEEAGHRQRTGEVQRPAQPPHSFGNDHAGICPAEIEDPELPVAGVAVVEVAQGMTHGASGWRVVYPDLPPGIQ